MNIYPVLIFLLSALVISMPASAMVRGDCVNCHSMHNSQDGTAVGGRVDSGFDSTESLANLLNNDCIGCHGSSGSATILSLGETRIPIVYNLSEPAQPLAGGNFFWVETVGDGYGHNVRLSDSILDRAPGGDKCGVGGCHASLASIKLDQAGKTIEGNGCVGCHDPAQHADDESDIRGGGAKYVSEQGGGYRFINQAAEKFVSNPNHRPPAMVGLEDPNWEQNPSSTVHNEYRDSDKNGFNNNDHGMSDFCTGCHDSYHAVAGNSASPDGDLTSPWLRHPAGVELPDSGEYAGYTVYDPQVPIARPDIATIAGLAGPSSEVTPGVDRVMCLFCHRSHGSPYPDMLRWAMK